MSNDKCNHCNKRIPPMHGVNTEIKGKQVFLCGACWNAFISDEMGMDFATIDLKPISLADCDGQQHTFLFFTHMVPSGLAIRAREFLERERIGYEFSVLGDFNCNQSDLILDLYEKIKRGLATKYIEHDKESGKQIKDMRVIGRIEWDSSHEGEIPELCIDGKRLSWGEFGKMLMTFEGYQFKMDIVDPFDDVRAANISEK